MENQIELVSLFASPIYVIDKLEFLDVCKKISNKFIAKRKEEKELNSSFPVYMTENLNSDLELMDFANFVAQKGWDILTIQGYETENLITYFNEMWCQEHHFMSSMEKHIHGNGSQISGFYFLDCPENSSKLVFHDPKDSKVIINLPEKDANNVTQASNLVNITPKEGQLIFSNSWLPHSFTKNLAKEPMRFIHFNIAVEKAANMVFSSNAEVV